MLSIHAPRKTAMASRDPRRPWKLAPRRPARIPQPRETDYLLRRLQEPPPPGEHAGLHRFHRRRTGAPVDVSAQARSLVGTALVARFQQDGCPVLCAAVSALHAHVLVEMPDDLPEVRRLVGRAKEKSSRQANKLLAGFHWSQGGTYKPVNSLKHRENAFDYILTRQSEGAWTWRSDTLDVEPRPRGSKIDGTTRSSGRARL